MPTAQSPRTSGPQPYTSLTHSARFGGGHQPLPVWLSAVLKREGRSKKQGGLGLRTEVQFLTEVVGTGSELGNLKMGGSRRDPQDLLIAQGAPSVSEVSRNEPTGRAITSTDPATIWTPARAKDPITAGTLGKVR